MSSKRLAIYLGCAILTYCVVGGVVMIKNARHLVQERNNMQQVAAHLAFIRPQWENFKRTNAGLEMTEIASTYHEEGSLAVYGAVTSQVQVAQVLQFLLDTRPPRPLYTNGLRVDAAGCRDSVAELVGSADAAAPHR